MKLYKDEGKYYLLITSTTGGFFNIDITKEDYVMLSRAMDITHLQVNMIKLVGDLGQNCMTEAMTDWLESRDGRCIKSMSEHTKNAIEDVNRIFKEDNYESD